MTGWRFVRPGPEASANIRVATDGVTTGNIVWPEGALLSRTGSMALQRLAILFVLLLTLSPASRAQGLITTVAGCTWIFRGDGGPAASAPLGNIAAVAVDASGNIYAADSSNDLVVKVSAAGLLTVVAGNGIRGFSGDGALGPSASLFSPGAVAVDAAGNVYLADTLNHRVRRVSRGIITTIAGTGTAGFSGDGGAAASARLNAPAGVAVDAAGNVYVADMLNHRIRKVAADGTVTTIAGSGARGFSGDNGAATQASLNSPRGVAFDAAGNLYIADRDNHRIRRVTPGGIITTVAGSGSQGFSGDGGPATSAKLNFPYAVAVDAAGSLYIADGEPANPQGDGRGRHQHAGRDGLPRLHGRRGSGDRCCAEPAPGGGRRHR